MNQSIRTGYLFVNRYYDRLEKIWESQGMRAVVGYFVVIIFLASLLIIQLKRMALLPESLQSWIPASHFYAVHLVFYLLMIFEVIALVFSLTHSISESVGKQFEILSLILLRSVFKDFVVFPEPLTVHHIDASLIPIAVDALGALAVFILLGVYYKMQRHPRIIKDEEEEYRFISVKKVLSMLLLVTFLGIGLFNLVLVVSGRPSHDFFSIFYTILIFTDILVVLISLRYSYQFCTLFRNSGFALTTVFIRLALSADPIINVILGVSAILFAIALTYAYNLNVRKFLSDAQRPGFHSLTDE